METAALSRAQLNHIGRLGSINYPNGGGSRTSIYTMRIDIKNAYFWQASVRLYVSLSTANIHPFPITPKFSKTFFNKFL